MKYLVTVANRTYQVEIEDIHARPVIVHVDGQVFEVNPESERATAVHAGAPQVQPFTPVAPPPKTMSPNEMTAPLPGTVIEVFVKPGDHIESGQVILIIEAMKMKNSIRSTRAGQVHEVLVKAGETVIHKQPLVRFG